MADIDIEKKKPVWPWILLGLVILALLLFLVFANDDQIDDTEDFEDTETEQLDTMEDDQMRDTLSRTTTGDDVESYMTYIEDTTRMGVDHDYTSGALIHLVNAVESKAREMNYDIDANLVQLQQDAERLSQDPTATDHANQIKQAGEEIAGILEGMQEENYPGLSDEVEEVKTAVEDIDPNQDAMQQRETIKTFFEEAGDVLREMS